MEEDSPYAFEVLARTFVDKEKSGFDQCRNKLIGWADRRIEQTEDTPRKLSEDWAYLEGKEDAYRDLLAYLKGTDL